MISNEDIKTYILPKLSKLRPFDESLAIHFLHNNDLELIKYLSEFQNSDGGFGNGLEADIRLPNSSVIATCMAISILEDIKDNTVKKDINQKIVQYLEKAYKEDTEEFPIVPKEVDDYPHAIWWNYNDIASFTWGNPNPEIIGYLYQYREFISTLDINSLITKTVDYIKNDFKTEASMHNLLSVLKFYKRVDKDIQNLVKDDIQAIVNDQLETDSSKWNGYSLEPYKIAIIDKSFLRTHVDLLQENLDGMYEKIKIDVPKPNWDWVQYQDVFATVKQEWIGIMTFEYIKALRINRK